MPYDRERWAKYHDGGQHPHAMDARHVEMIYEVLTRERPPRVVEIGCYRGYSTSAVVQAIVAEAVEFADLVDAGVTDELRQVASAANGRCMIYQTDSKDFNGRADCWLIDGDHGEGALWDFVTARSGGARIIIAHDTNNVGIYPNHWGAVMLGELIRKSAVAWFEDSVTRDFEKTHRGLTIGFYDRAPKAETLDKLKALAS